jgi:sialate O-acetylesterase
MYQDHVISGNTVSVRFKHAGDGLASNDNAALTWFELSPDGQNYFKAQAEISGLDTVKVSAADVPQPKFVRFGWHALARHNLINKKGLPAVSFRAGSK